MEKTLTYYVTDDYDKFKILEHNRSIGNHKNLSKSIDSLDLTKFVPIVVSEDFTIIDGQHRFMYCMEHHLPIYYIMCDVSPEVAMVTLNTAVKPWKQQEWLEYYVSLGRVEYVKLNELMKRHGTNISNSILLFSLASCNSKEFKAGNLKDNSILFEPVVEFINSCELPIATKNYRAFVHAVMLFLKDNNDKRKINRLKRKIIACPKFSLVADYLNAFENLSK